MSHRFLGAQFHGSLSEMKVGDVVLPKARHDDGYVSHEKNDPNYAYATDDPLHAIKYARAKAMINSAGEGMPERWHVYRVEPVDDHEPDPNYADAPEGSPQSIRSRSGFRVVGDVSEPTRRDWLDLPFGEEGFERW